MIRSIDLKKASELNDTHINIIQILEESEADNWREGVPGKSISELADELDRAENTISERVSELEDLGFAQKNSSEYGDRSMVIRLGNEYDMLNKKSYMKEHNVSGF